MTVKVSYNSLPSYKKLYLGQDAEYHFKLMTINANTINLMVLFAVLTPARISKRFNMSEVSGQFLLQYVKD